MVSCLISYSPRQVPLRCMTGEFVKRGRIADTSENTLKALAEFATVRTQSVLQKQAYTRVTLGG